MGLLRLLLALSVVIWHSQPLFGLTLIGGPNAVDIFFAISGFYMAMILTEKYQKQSFKTFITNRFLKIYPTYWICLVVSVAVAYLGFILVSNNDLFRPFTLYVDKMNLVSLFYIIFANLFILGQDLMLFLGFNASSRQLYFTNKYTSSNPQMLSFFPIDQAWSISLELIFYLMAPLLTKLKSRYLLLIIALSIMARIFVYHQGLNYDPWNYRFFPLEIVFFLAGILGYRLYSQIKTIPKFKIYGLCSFFVIIASSILFQFAFPGLNTEVKRWLYSGLVIPLIPLVFNTFKNWHFDRILGDLSFPLYLSHNIFIYIIFQLLNYKGTYSSVLVISASLIFSYLLIKLVINPLEKIRQARVSN